MHFAKLAVSFWCLRNVVWGPLLLLDYTPRGARGKGHSMAARHYLMTKTAPFPSQSASPPLFRLINCLECLLWEWSKIPTSKEQKTAVLPFQSLAPNSLVTFVKKGCNYFIGSTKPRYGRVPPRGRERQHPHVCPIRGLRLYEADLQLTKWCGWNPCWRWW